MRKIASDCRREAAEIYHTLVTLGLDHTDDYTRGEVTAKLIALHEKTHCALRSMGLSNPDDTLKHKISPDEKQAV